MSRPIESIKNRLQTALDYNGMKPVELALKANIPKSSISQYLSGYAKPSADRLYSLSKALNVEEAWLLGYDVPMRNEEEEDDNTYYLDPEVADMMQDLKDKNSSMRILFDASRRISKEDMELVIAFIERLKK